MARILSQPRQRAVDQKDLPEQRNETSGHSRWLCCSFQIRSRFSDLSIKIGWKSRMTAPTNVASEATGVAAVSLNCTPYPLSHLVGRLQAVYALMYCLLSRCQMKYYGTASLAPECLRCHGARGAELPALASACRTPVGLCAPVSSHFRTKPHSATAATVPSLARTDKWLQETPIVNPSRQRVRP
ncbi:hypothetical protein LX36DRAFT_442384 [Colletotrichum falcatum]|nr:hypothetical protein LX36DRAFT_442384 [Colletotrichum falcatum]